MLTSEGLVRSIEEMAHLEASVALEGGQGRSNCYHLAQHMWLDRGAEGHARQYDILCQDDESPSLTTHAGWNA